MADFSQKDYYQILQVDPTDAQEEIEASYQRLARKYDPTTSANPNAAARLQEINEAYEILGDPVKRAAYDQGSAAQPGPETAPEATQMLPEEKPLQAKPRRGSDNFLLNPLTWIVFMLAVLVLAFAVKPLLASVSSGSGKVTPSAALAYAVTQTSAASNQAAAQVTPGPTKVPGCTVSSLMPTAGPTEQSLFPSSKENDWTKGPADAANTIIEYSDFQ